MRAAIRLLCSDDVPAPINAEILKALRSKHPPAPTDRRPTCSYTGNLRFQPLQVSSDDIMKSLRTFTAGSAGGLDGLTASHLSDLLNSATDDKLKDSLTDFVNLLLKGDLPVPVREILYGGRLIALQKRDIRPIAVGYTLRRLVAKCGNAFVINKGRTRTYSSRRRRLWRCRNSCTQHVVSYLTYQIIMFLSS